MTIYIGIDPGKTGGWAAMASDGNYVASSPFDGYLNFYRALKDLTGMLHIAVEHVHAMPGQGVTSMFNFGMNFGGWLATLEVMGKQPILVRPQAWQKAILGPFPKGKSKVFALEYMKIKYPELKLKKKDSGIVDALCIAEWCRRFG